MNTRSFLAIPLLLVLGEAMGEAPSTPLPAQCEIPLRWSITELDERFGLTREEASDAVRHAGMLWSDAAGQPLLFQESAEGLPIRFIYEERQEVTVEHRRREAEAQQAATRVAEAEAGVDALRAELERRREAHELRSRELQERLASHRRAVELWNQRGGAPPDEFRRLSQMQEELDREQQALDEATGELNALVGRVNAETERLNREIAAHNRARTELVAELPASTLPSAEYREIRRGLGPFTASITREIAIFRFEDRNHLILLIARQLGRALGLESSEVPGSLMAEGRDAQGPDGFPALHPTDVEQLRAVCPVL